VIYYKDGDLLKSDCTVIMHQANCFSTMGAGIARQIAFLYPGAERADREHPCSPKGRLGSFSYSEEKDFTVVNLYGQFSFGPGRQTDYRALQNAIDKFFTHAKESNIDLSKVGVPFNLGSGLAGGRWSIVERILKEESDKHGVDIYVYKLQ